MTHMIIITVTYYISSVVVLGVFMLDDGGAAIPRALQPHSMRLLPPPTRTLSRLPPPSSGARRRTLFAARFVRKWPQNRRSSHVPSFPAIIRARLRGELRGGKELSVRCCVAWEKLLEPKLQRASVPVEIFTVVGATLRLVAAGVGLLADSTFKANSETEDGVYDHERSWAYDGSCQVKLNAGKD
ncbi:hypothetical protein F443_17649 [Phytophthora nicotianae P1569]|uniref:Uncharacterized protein n=1 Tax=Phytophthora nicotianae P1569 TaxID=1317065 RepID=V9EAS0_PHYNI|nr:hypothetical protein F443_17649 [Phytophthora nicotianae P1569]